ncbi:OLC1v1000848C1 [Oldenlandia corymbosa var. corymbosa]|uniref:OLC1v1000848C1 n=1 Tax=Oldenlandia corymbosa var. corymbosa TaxID=529605 RepID=A0AAV1D3Y8_OLDCO|nr:OLC1v1000848C1 [Oldenlandia corymbosa var. corymbosa]
MGIVLKFKKKGPVGSFRKHPRKNRHPLRAITNSFLDEFRYGSSSPGQVNKLRDSNKELYELIAIVPKPDSLVQQVKAAETSMSKPAVSPNVGTCSSSNALKKVGGNKFKIIMKKKKEMVAA